jgi:hypothetical protein
VPGGRCKVAVNGMVQKEKEAERYRRAADIAEQLE